MLEFVMDFDFNNLTIAGLLGVGLVQVWYMYRVTSKRERETSLQREALVQGAFDRKDKELADLNDRVYQAFIHNTEVVSDLSIAIANNTEATRELVKGSGDNKDTLNRMDNFIRNKRD